MSYFKGLKLTRKGEQLQAKINGNLSETLTFTKAKLGSGNISSEDEIRFLTDLKSAWGTATISRCEIKEDSQVELELQFDNSNFRENKIFKEIGLYAKTKNNQEVLFAYSNARENYDYIPAVQDSPHVFIITIHFMITSGTKVNANIDLNSYITQETLNQKVLTKQEVETILGFNPVRNEFVLATLDDIRNLFPRASISNGAFNLGHISSEQTKMVNMLLLSNYNEYLQQRLNIIKGIVDALSTSKAERSALNNYYVKSAIDSMLSTKADKTTLNSIKSSLESMLSTKASTSDMNSSLSTKVDKTLEITLGNGLIGGGALTKNIVINVANLTLSEVETLLERWR